jgi:gliding motility-associated-like protein
MKNNLLVLLLLCLGFVAQSQDRFHRNYPLAQDSFAQTLGGIVLKDQTYLVVSGITINAQFLSSVIFTNLDNKGDVNWVKKITVDSTTRLYRFSKIDFNAFQGFRDSIFYSVDLFDGTVKQKLIGSMSSQGIIGWSNVYSSTDRPNGSSNGTNKSVFLRDSIFFQLNDFRDSIVHVSAINSIRGRLLSSFTLSAPTLSLVGRDISFSRTKNILITGSNLASNRYFVAIGDTLGRVKSGRSYTINAGSNRVFLPTAIEGTPDSGFIVVGRYYIVNATNVANSFFGSYVAKHDSSGRVLWSKYINVQDSFPVAVNNVSVTRNNNYYVGGNFTDPKTGNDIPFMIGLRSNGVKIFAKKYSRVTSLRDFPGAVDTLANGTAAMFTSIILNKQVERSQMSLIKVDGLGSSSCEDTIGGTLLFDLLLTNDTLPLTSTAVTNVTSRPIRMRTTDAQLNVTTTKLEVRPFCPNEPVIWTFRAKTPGAVAYKWSTGATTDSLTVRETGTYSVTITIDSAVCYTLCDTANLGKYEKPKVDLAVSPGNFCTNGLMTVQSSYTPGAPLRSIVWSNGATGVNRIEQASGPATVTVTDQCNEVATASTTVTPLRLIQTVTVTPGFGSFCTTNTGSMVATADAVITRYRWSTGAITSGIGFSQPGTYNVTVTDLCGNEKTGSSTVLQTSIPKIINTIEIIQDNSGFCKDQTVKLAAMVNGQFNAINWSNGQNGNEITIPGVAGTTITATATAECGNKSASVTLAEIDPICLKAPKIFFPESNLVQDAANDNKTFRLNSRQCGNAPITDFELHIFNRWGQEVFSTTDITGRWDGKFKENAAPPDVYVYYMKYKQNDCVLDKKADLTLHRD